MKNLFSSPSNAPDLQKLFQSIEIIKNEQRHQRMDLATIKNQLHTLIKDLALQKQVDEYFDSDSRDTTDTENLEDNIKTRTEI